MDKVWWDFKEVLPNLYQLKLYDESTKYFEGMWEIPEGVTYNAYLYLGDEVVLFDGWKVGHGKALVKAIKEFTDKVDYYVVHHVEPDHSGSFVDVVNEFNPKVIAHPMAKNLLSEYYGISFEFVPARDGFSFEGFETYTTPWLHWPETIMTYWRERKALITCDAFGSFGFARNLWLSRKYFMTVVGKYKDFVIRAVEKLSKLEVEKVLPAHGPTWGKEIIEEWVKWAKGEEKNKATLIYGTMYGFSREVVRVVVEALKRRGVEVHAFPFTDRLHSPISEILTDVVDSAYVVVVAPTYEGGPFWPVRDAVETLAEKAKYKKKVMIVNTCGWGCNPKPYAEAFERGGYEVKSVVSVKGRLKDPEEIEAAVETLLS